MSRRVKEFVDIEDHASIDDLIHKLKEIRDGLPKGADAELKLRGDEVFGRRITITYFRELTKEEAEIEKRYAEAEREAKERELARLQAELVNDVHGFESGDDAGTVVLRPRANVPRINMTADNYNLFGLLSSGNFADDVG